jgi:hypothetical protein
MTLTLQPTRVATGGDEEGMLVFAGDRLVAVLVHLSDENEIAPGDWYLEAGFGRCLDLLEPGSGAGLDQAAAGAALGPEPMRAITRPSPETSIRTASSLGADVPLTRQPAFCRRPRCVFGHSSFVWDPVR